MILLIIVLVIVLLQYSISSKCENEQCDHNDIAMLSTETKNHIYSYYLNPTIKIPVNDDKLVTINLPIVDQILDFCLENSFDKFDCHQLVHSINDRFISLNKIDCRLNKDVESDNKIVTVDLMGGLGNQLFQVFATIAYSIRTNTKVVFPYLLAGINALRPQQLRRFYFNNFLLSLRQNSTFGDSNIDGDNSKLLMLPRFFQDLYEYIPIPKVSHSFKLAGQFLSYKYFDDVYDKICDIINLREIQMNIKQQYSYYFPNDMHIVGMHFRLGDYKFSKAHRILPFEYYDLAISTIIGKASNDKITVLYCNEKEDNDTVNEIIGRLISKYPLLTFSKINDSIADWIQMILLSLCHDVIIANSSFSWWSAYFNNYNKKMITYPSSYYYNNDDNKKMNDYYPNDWMQIQI